MAPFTDALCCWARFKSRCFTRLLKPAVLSDVFHVFFGPLSRFLTLQSQRPSGKQALFFKILLGRSYAPIGRSSMPTQPWKLCRLFVKRELGFLRPVGQIPKATHMPKAPSPILWWMWRTFVGTLFRFWETDFYTPPVLGGAALFDNSAPAVYKILGPSGTRFLYTAGTELWKWVEPPSTGGV